ncbi:TonB-dependent receptor plug domain-containing protein [Roseomonas xinghualingensis]|uniref:TonB-dependent receptor plug domain-containing protein n=1 Tax=Roseomonas xinghualingensis TaxID=2986475 RepID=UPI0021F1F919|nr:TonB-dependent receptor [Roseomonas sp. SXEYE001]MCV4206515.1 TonB-dependent receptor [Roseomonas sp. SXEYE001]
MRRLLLLSFTALAPTALAQATPPVTQPSAAVAETVVTATRVPTPIERVPAGITVIGRRTIEERGYQTLSEALATVPGLSLLQSGGIGQPSSAFIRGTASRHALVLLDGVPINDASEPNGAFNFGNELLGLDVERIEVLRGPASSLYGSGAIGGVVNIVTRRAPKDRAIAPYGELAGGSNRTLRTGAGIAGTVGEFDYLLSLRSLSTRGTDATPSRFARDTGERDGFRSAGATVRLGWTPSERFRLEGLANWRENHGGLDDVPNDDPNYSFEDRRYSGQIRAEGRPFEAWTTGFRIARTMDRRKYENLADSLSLSTTDDLYRGERTVFDWGNQLRLPDAGFADQSQLSFGVTHEREEVRQASGSASFRTTVDADASSTGLHAGYQIRLFRRLDLSAGIRNDDAEDYGNHTTYRLGAVLALPEIGARLRTAYGTAFKAPSLYQRYGRIGTFFQGNPNLRPESSTGWEAGVEFDIPLAGQTDFVTLGATYYDSRIRDLINYDAFFTTLENIDRARIKGAEFTATLRPAHWLTVNAAYSITDARDARSGERLARRPEQQLALNASIQPIEKVTIAPELILYGRSREGAFASYRDDGSAYTIARDNKAGAVFNLTATWQVTEPVALFAEGRNLTDSDFEPVNGFVIPGRTVLVGTRFQF